MEENFDLVTTLTVCRQKKMEPIERIRQWHEDPGNRNLPAKYTGPRL
jgi:hypothetical protein